MKKQFLFIGAVFMVLAAAAFAQTEADFKFNNGTITGYTGTSKDVVIPAQINGIPVTSIGDRAFAENQLTSVTIPNSVTEIGEGAFAGNPISGFFGYYLSVGKKAGTYSVTGKSWLRPLSDAEAKLAATEDDFDIEQLANGTLRITGYSGKAKNVVIPAAISGVRVTIIGEGAFKEKGLYSVVIPDWITEIGEYAFSGCALSGAGITWGKGLVTIGRDAFASNNFTELTFPNSVTLVQNGAFAGNPLTAIVFPASLAQYADYSSKNPRGSQCIHL